MVTLIYWILVMMKILSSPQPKPMKSVRKRMILYSMNQKKMRTKMMKISLRVKRNKTKTRKMMTKTYLVMKMTIITSKRQKFNRRNQLLVLSKISNRIKSLINHNKNKKMIILLSFKKHPKNQNYMTKFQRNRRKRNT